MYLYVAALIVSFALMFKSAGFFVEGACRIARVLNISKMVTGIVLVAFATTAPEFVVSVQAAFLGHPEISLGNAIGSVICDDGIALALAALLAPAAIPVNCRLLKSIGPFILFIDVFVYLLAKNGTIGRLEGIVFILISSFYFLFLIREQRQKRRTESQGKDVSNGRDQLRKSLFFFAGGIIGVIVTSRLVIWASIHIASHFSISETLIGLTVIAIGTSLPEISTCVAASLKGEGEIAIGNILGADILNVLWIVGASSVARPITVDLDLINFAFPFMILIVAAMLVGMRVGCRLGKIEGLVLLGLYGLYFFLNVKLFL